MSSSVYIFLIFCISVQTSQSSWILKDRDTTTTTTAPETDEKAAFDKIWDINSKKNDAAFSTDEKGNNVKLFEGDIHVTQEDEEQISKNKISPSEVSPLDAMTSRLWPGGEVPYTFIRGFGYQSVVNQAIQHYNKHTCIRFVPRTNQPNYVEFIHGGGCYSMIGRQGGKQQISLGNGCGQIGVTIHEMMHALGFYHEQSRRDRDQYISIYFNNIRRQMWYNFEKYRQGQASTLGEQYDKQSVMHYGNYAFSTNGQKTIVSKSNPGEQLGQRNGLSQIDINQLKKAYKCSGVVTTDRPTTKDCKDKNTLCSKLAENNLCRYEFIKTECKVSCKDPSCKKTNCIDNKEHKKNCPGWAKYNSYCRFSSGCCKNGEYVSFMKSNCKRSCGFC